MNNVRFTQNNMRDFKGKNSKERPKGGGGVRCVTFEKKRLNRLRSDYKN